MQKRNRTDRTLILIALAIVLLVTGLFYFDDWMWGNQRDRGERIGVITERHGDVRVKFTGDLKWQSAHPGQDLVYNDSVYSGADSKAALALGKSELDLTANTLIVLRRENAVNFMNLSFGSLFGKVAKNEKFVIDTGNGKTIEFDSDKGAQIRLSKTNGKTELKVVSGSGDVKVNGRTTHVDPSVKIVDGQAQPKAPSAQNSSLQALEPLHDHVIYSEQPQLVPFAWKWNAGRAAAQGERYTVEFSTTEDFADPYFRKEVTGRLGTTLSVSQTMSLYYRVRGPAGETSQPEKLNFVRMNKPLIVSPRPEERVLAPVGQKPQVSLGFNRADNSITWFQIAADPDFKTVVSNDSTPDLQTVRELPLGNYYLRAKSDYGNGHETGWTETVPFHIESALQAVPLAESRGPNDYLIPNRDYPSRLYGKSGNEVRSYLAAHGILRNYFGFPKQSYDKIWLKFSDGKMAAQTDTAWPKDRLQPGHYVYKYQLSKEGFSPSPWTPNRSFDIAMEPPRPVGQVHYGALNKSGETRATWSFTPLLFAGSYDVQVAASPDMTGAEEINTAKTTVSKDLSGQNYWRVRARDKDGRIISEYSPVYDLHPPVPQFLARNDVNRRPAQASSTTHIEREHDEPFVKNGWWGWLGAGDNYVDYRQSDPGIGTLRDFHTKGPSQYLEIGFDGKNGWGGVFTYKHTPGTIIPPAPYTIDNGAYVWDTYTMEGIYRRMSPFRLFDYPVYYGIRVGIQHHHMPFVIVNTDPLGGTDLLMRYSTILNASAGILAEWERRRWTYYWMMRYQYPLTTTADGASSFSVDPVFAFDGSVGMSYNLTQQFKAGLFWYGQWHQFNFHYGDGVNDNSGYQMLFYSNVDFRLGWDF